MGLPCRPRVNYRGRAVVLWKLEVFLVDLHHLQQLSVSRGSGRPSRAQIERAEDAHRTVLGPGCGLRGPWLEGRGWEVADLASLKIPRSPIVNPDTVWPWRPRSSIESVPRSCAAASRRAVPGPEVANVG